MDTRQDKLLQGQVDLQSQLSHFAMDNASIEIYWLSSDGRICYANKQACQTIGYSQEEFALLSLTDLDPNFPVEQWQLHWESLRRDKRQSFETQHQRKNGELFPVRVIANYVYFCGQEYNVGYAIDISARKESERILKKEADKNLALLRNASDGIHILDANGNILEASDSFCTMLGYTRDEIIGMNVSVWDAGFSTPEELKLVVQKQLKSPDRSEFGTRHRRKDGSVIDVEVSGNAFELDGEAALFNSSRDVTARKKLEFELKQHDLRFKNMFDLSPDPVLIIDGNHFIECNQAAINLLGYTKSALLNKHPSELSPEFQPDGEASFTKAERIFSTIEAKSIDRFEWVHRRADGEDFYAEVTLSLMVLDGRNVIYCVWRDITERKLTDAMIQNSNQRLEAVLQAVPDLLFEMDLEGRYLNVWGGNQDLLTAPESHLIGRTVEEMLPAREAQEILAALAEADKSGRSAGHQIQLILPHGACWFELSVAKQAANKLHGVSFIVLSRDITSRKQAEDEIRNLAFYDALTKLPNRRLLLDRLRSALTASSRSKMYGAVLFLDLDRFKILNDTLGHDYGDLLLIEVAKRLQSCMREIDTVARLGGDEFVVLIEEIDEQADNASQKIALIAEKIRSSLSAPYILNSSAHYSSPSIGVCLYQGSEESLDVILKRADMAMYRAKESGRNAIRFFDPACSKE